jgi:tRNA pseudouridine55 synthase
VSTDGVILYDKEPGVTSHDVVARVRRRFPKGTKVGHAGTLDPFATGLLLVLVGRATRVQRLLMGLPKRYETEARFGATSTTGDPEGVIVETGVLPVGALALPTGTIAQVPPAYSAVKVNGRRAYELARAGVAVELKAREIEVYAFDELWQRGDRRAFAIRCSSGTYIRSLVMGLGDAYCAELRRTHIGAFDVADADPERILSLNDALAHLPEVRLEAEDAKRAGYGAAVPGPSAEATPAGSLSLVRGGQPIRLVDSAGLIAIAESTDDGGLKPVIGFRG